MCLDAHRVAFAFAPHFRDESSGRLAAHVGASIWARRGASLSPDALQFEFSLMSRDIEREILPLSANALSAVEDAVPEDAVSGDGFMQRRSR
jgi:hypothetical protein